MSGGGTKIVLLGAGSISFGMSMLRDLVNTRELSGSTVVLVTQHAGTAGRTLELARYLNGKAGAGLAFEATSDRRAALDGAQFVVNATAIDRNRLWKLDFEVPRKYGIRHTLGENGGPGGLFFTMRTLPMIFDFVRDMEELCPDALFLNFSNPESRIVMALGRYSRIRCVGLCHGIYLARNRVAEILQLPAEEVEVWGGGLNHFQCLLHIRHRTTGEDLYPRLRATTPDAAPTLSPLTRELLRAFGYWLGCGDSHLGEFLPYGWEGGEEGYDFAGDERWRSEFITMVDGVLSESKAMPAWWLQPSGEKGAALIAAVHSGEERFLDSGVVYNQGAILNLPAELAVEVPVVANATGVHPVSIGALPDPVAKLMAMQANVQQLAVEAAVHASRELALQALLIDPVVNSVSAARRLLDELWDINRSYIRKCI